MFMFLQGTLGRCPTPIFFVFSYVVVLEKLSATSLFFLFAQIGFLGMKTTPENWGAKYLSNFFTYNSGIFYNETNWKNFPQWEIQNVIF